MTEENAQKTFGEWLKFLLFTHGARPNGSPENTGQRWGQKEFADAVNLTPKAIQHWLKDKKTPNDFKRIEEVLFGKNNRFEDWRKRLRAAHTEAKNRTLPPRKPRVDGLTSLIEVSYVEVPQDFFGKYIAKTMGFEHSYDYLDLHETTGNVDTNRSGLVLKGGVRVNFSYDHVNQAQKLMEREQFKSFLDQGFSSSCWVIKGFKERWQKKGLETPTRNIICLFERGNVSFGDVDSKLICDNLLRYALSVPDDCDRGFLNCLPSPSLSKKLFAELIFREAWGEIEFIFHNISGIRNGFMKVWACDIVRRHHDVKNSYIKNLLNKSTEAKSAIVPQALYFLNLWLRKA